MAGLWGGRVAGALRLLVVCGALGMVTAVLVAWGLAAWLPHRSLTKRYNVIGTPAGGGSGYVSVYEVRRPGMIRRGWGPGLAAAPPFWGELSKDATIALKLKTARQDRSWGELPRELEGERATLGGMEDARGWPFLALWCSLDASASQGIGPGEPAPGGIAVTRRGAKSTAAHFRALPMRPIWPGLGVNSGVFAVVWLGVFGMVWAGRRAVRSRRGRCVGCGYDVCGDRVGGCPECGRGRGAAAPVSCGDGRMARG